jgi:(1->4)-alpha-D-glucan 1-alpha-D-glucosylmutase
VPYLDALGVTDVYASPFLAARTGSMHGYDVVDHDRLNPELGTEADLDALVAALRARGMGLLMDVVPNHMCIATAQNLWWNDVLENGRSSPHAPYFDVDWHPPKTELHEKVLLPVLGEQYGRVLENQEISIGYEGGAFQTRYHDARFPVGPRTVRPLLEPMVADLKRSHPDDHPDVLELESILTAIRHLPKRWDTEPDQVRERQREKEIVKRRIAVLVDGSVAVREALARSLTAMNGQKGQPHSFDKLEALLADQAYRLSYWGVAAEEINYRRFFDINDLAAIRVEEPTVLAAVHGKPFQLLRDAKVTGFRIDHVDGLYDPRKYLADLQATTAPPDGPPTYVVVEKILTGDETLPQEWPVQGTTGYEFMNMLNGLFVEPAGARAIERLYQRLRDGGVPFDELLYRCKRLILRSAMSSELYVLARQLDRISEQHRWSRDFTLNTLHLALGEVVACFPVYRTYVQPGSVEVSARDRLHVLTAVRNAKRRNRATSESIFDFIADILLLRDPEGLSDADRADRRHFVLRLQQLTGPVMAKGLEDTAFYRYFPLASLNEVGGRPTAVTGTDVAGFHLWNARRSGTWPHGLSATATHDTKRGEDVRTRLDVLSEMPRDWQLELRRWQRINRRKKPLVDDDRVPDANDEYLLYQTLIGIWPWGDTATEAARSALYGRVSSYMKKALREAKVHTSWINVNEGYENGVDEFLRLILEDSPSNPFLPDLKRFVATVAMPGLYNSLAQVVLKVTSPGVPDFYQGTELWDLSLVDPDNRRPVDYAHRQALLAALAALPSPGELERQLAHPEDGVIKLLVTARALRHRRRHRAVFATGTYLPLGVQGAQARHALAFARTLPDGAASITVAGRFFSSLGAATRPPVGAAVWGDTRVLLDSKMPAGAYRDALSGQMLRVAPDRSLALAEAFAKLPVAILEPDESG